MSKAKRVFRLGDLERKYGRLTIGRILKAWRENNGLSQDAFARKVGLSQTRLSELEIGRGWLPPENAHRVGARMGYSPGVMVAVSVEERLAKAGLRYRILAKPAGRKR